ncbi:VOC family protein [Microlunatus soli]|nr:VOC family protein [Microlunatus soli]
MPNRWASITVDCADPDRLAAFWGTLLDLPADPDPLPGWAGLARDRPPLPRINFQPVTEPKRAKVRIHLDVAVDDIDRGIAQVLELGGAATGERHDYDEGVVVVMADPEGNEFCLVEYY